MAETETQERITSTSGPVPLFAPNGNGGVYKSLEISGCYDSLVAKKIQYVHFVGIDNIIMIPAG
jgi:UDP-N-acetylglucosamine pyrophosphorylase